MEKNVFITGATGVLGKRVVKGLLANGYKVVCLCRSDENQEKIEGLGATPIRGNLFNSADMISCTKDCDVIIHLATKIPKKLTPAREEWRENDKIRTHGTLNLLMAAKHNGIEKFVFQSTGLLYGNHYGKTVTETTKISGQQPFMLKSAYEMEAMILRSNLNYIGLRFGNFYSTDSFQTTALLKAVRERRAPIIGKGDFYTNVIHADDAASALLFAIENYESLQGNVLNVSDFNPITFRQMLKSFQKITKSKDPIRLPHILAKLTLGNVMYQLLTNSFCYTKHALLSNWHPVHKNIDEGLREILFEMT